MNRIDRDLSVLVLVDYQERLMPTIHDAQRAVDEAVYLATRRGSWVCACSGRAEPGGTRAERAAVRDRCDALRRRCTSMRAATD